VTQRTEELQLTLLTKINVLRGLLPICSSCKKIRDDQGYWKQVEHFVAEHSQAQLHPRGVSGVPDPAVRQAPRGVSIRRKARTLPEPNL
jgi:hypothetical protein